MAKTTSTLSSSIALRTLGGQNPFALTTIRERRQQAVTFPEVDSSTLRKPERAIYHKAREDALAIGLTAVKGNLAVAATEELEDFTHTLFARTTSRIEQRMWIAQRASKDEEFQALNRIFAVEASKRMGAAMVAMVDATERGMQTIVERELSVDDEQPSVMELLFRRRQ